MDLSIDMTNNTRSSFITKIAKIKRDEKYLHDRANKREEILKRMIDSGDLSKIINEALQG